MSKSEVELKRIITEAMCETLTMYGFDRDKPRSMQQDLAFLRRIRIRRETANSNIFKAIITVIATGSLIFIWDAFKDLFRH